MFGGFSASKLKPHLKMAVSRIQIASNKKSALLKQNMREIALMLSEDPPKEEKAKIRAEALIRDDNLIEAYEILQLQCELLHERIKLIEYQKTCPDDLVAVVSTLIWAAHRVDIPELMLIRKQFRAKYGKQFEEDALSNAGNVLNERVVSKLSVHPPAAYLVQTYLERICDQYQVDWTPKVKLSTNQMIEPMAAPVGYSVQVAQGTGLGLTVDKPIPTVVDNDEDDKGLSSKPAGSVPPPIVTAHAYVPPTAGTKSNGTVKQNDSDFDEVDIFVPGAPTVPPGSTVTTPSGMGTVAKKDDDDDEDNDAPAPSSGPPSNNQVQSSYADLAARFENLKK